MSLAGSFAAYRGGGVSRMPGAHLSGHFPNEVSWQRVSGQSQTVNRVCSRCGTAAVYVRVARQYIFSSIDPRHPPLRGDFHTITEPAADFAWRAAIKQSERRACATSSVAPRLTQWSCPEVGSVARGAGHPQVPRSAHRYWPSAPAKTRPTRRGVAPSD